MIIKIDNCGFECAICRPLHIYGTLKLLFYIDLHSTLRANTLRMLVHSHASFPRI
jgi:hypothetical protein